MHYIIDEDLTEIARALKDEAAVLAGKTLLVSGGAGFLGCYIVGAIQRLNREVLPQPCHIIVVDNYITGSKNGFLKEIADENVAVREQDIRIPLRLDGPVDYIMHAAGLASPVYYRKYPLETIGAAIEGAKNLLELGREKQAKSFLLFSSSEIYGDPDPNFIPTPETYKGNVSCVGPRSCYDESKRLAETLAMSYHDVYGLPVKIVRPFNVYGPGMKADDYRVVPTFLARSLRGQPIPVHDKGNQTRTFCYIADAIVGFLKVLLWARGGEIYNVGRDKEEIDMMMLANTVAELFSRKPPIALVNYPETYPADEPRRRCPDLTKIRRELGYESRVDLKTGLGRTLEWFREVAIPPSDSVLV